MVTHASDTEKAQPHVVQIPGQIPGIVYAGSSEKRREHPMATKVMYPESPAPPVPKGVAQITYPEAGLPPADAEDRIGEPAKLDESWRPNAMPQVEPTVSETEFADRVLALKRKLVEAMASETSPEVASVALMSAAFVLADYDDTDEELRPRLAAVLRDYSRLHAHEA